MDSPHSPESPQPVTDREWLDTVFQGDVPQLTPRALVTGLALGWLMALSNLYVGLKSGWTLGIEITAIVLGFAVWKTLHGLRLSRRPLTMLENNIIMTCAVAPSYIASAGLVTAIPALWMVDPDFRLAWWQMSIWLTSILLLGLLVSIPIKRQLVNTGELAFPGVVPAAETLKSIYSRGGQAMRKASSLGIAGFAGMATKIVTEKAFLPALFTFPRLRIAGIAGPRLTLGFETSWIFIGFGAFVGTRVGISVLAGMLINFTVLAPWMIHRGEITHAPPSLTSRVPITFPLTIPAGSCLVFELEEAKAGPELEAGPVTARWERSWPNGRTCLSLEELVRELNRPYAGPRDGSPQLAFSVRETSVSAGEEAYRPIPFIPFELIRTRTEKRRAIQVEAPEAVHWDARLAIAAPVGRDTGTEARDAAPEGQDVAPEGRDTATEGRDIAQLLGFAPLSEDRQNAGGYRHIVAWSMWPGVGMMVVAGLFSFAFQWRTIGRSFSAMFRLVGGRSGTGNEEEDPLGDIEVPVKWFIFGFPLIGSLIVLLMRWLFGIPFWMGLIAVAISFCLAIVSVRVTGETGMVPLGPMGKVTQLTFGALRPGQMVTNLMTANVTAGAATSASDLTNQLKVGHMLGAKARLQFVAQLVGVISSLAVIPVFYILVPDASALGTPELPAPAAIVWAGVARLLGQGLGALPRSALRAMIIACLLAAALTTVEQLRPKLKSRAWFPSPVAVGVAMVIPAFYSLSMFIGAMLALLLSRASKKIHESYTTPVASGLIAGESLTGVFFAIWRALGG